MQPFVGPWFEETLAGLASRVRPALRLLLTGEPGTGKRTLARELCRRLPGASGGFLEYVAVGESEPTCRLLFGEEGRSPGREGGLYWPGAVERARGGVLLLTGIERADNRLADAIRLWLEDGRIVPLGGDERRVAPATCLATLDGEPTGPAARLVRLFDHVLRVKPLRERPADAEAFVRALADGLPPEAVSHLAAAGSPGNYPGLARLALEEGRRWSGYSPAEAEARLAEMRASGPVSVEQPQEQDAVAASGPRTKKDAILELAKSPDMAGLSIEAAAKRARASVSYTKKILKEAGIELK